MISTEDVNSTDFVSLMGDQPFNVTASIWCRGGHIRVVYATLKPERQ